MINFIFIRMLQFMGVRIMRRLVQKIFPVFLFLFFSFFCFANHARSAAFDGVLKGVTISKFNGENTPPIALIQYTVSGSIVQFDAGGSSDKDGTITEFQWDFGDGGTGVGNTITHQYVTEGDYPVTLKVMDDKGAIALSQITYHYAQQMEKVGEQILYQDRGGAVSAGSPIAIKVAGKPTHTGTLKSISFGVMGKGTSRPFRLALYKDQNGSPGALVPDSITIEKSTNANAFEILELPIAQGAPQIVAGEQYWIVVETTGTYLFYSDQWVSPGLIAKKSNILSYNWPDWQGTVSQTLSSKMGGCFFTYVY